MNTQLDVAHRTATNTVTVPSPSIGKWPQRPSRKSRISVSPELSKAIQKKKQVKINAKPGLSPPYHTQRQCPASARTEVHWMFSERGDSSKCRKKLNSLAVLSLKACCCKHIGFIYQQRTNFGNYSKTEHGSFMGTTGPTQNNIQELA